LKGSLELVFAEFPHEVLEAYRASKRAVWPNSPVDVSCIGAELRFAYHFLAHDGDGNTSRFAAAVLGRRAEDMKENKCAYVTRPLPVGAG
jgi:hypothetical protein